MKKDKVRDNIYLERSNSMKRTRSKSIDITTTTIPITPKRNKSIDNNDDNDNSILIINNNNNDDNEIAYHDNDDDDDDDEFLDVMETKPKQVRKNLYDINRGYHHHYHH